MKRDFGNVEQKFLFAHIDFAGKKVLEIGSGDGYYTEMLYSKAEQLVAIEPDAEKVAKAKTKITSNKVVFLQGKTEDLLDQLDRDFDIVIFPYSLHHHKYPLRVVKNVADKLKRGGQVIVIEPRADGDYCKFLQPLHDETEVLKKADDDLHRVFALKKVQQELEVNWFFDDQNDIRSCLKDRFDDVDIIESQISQLPEKDIVIKDKVVFWKIVRK